ncbi:MAG: glycosyltransferase family 2 protein, partial [Pseudobdellovibrio sp.]
HKNSYNIYWMFSPYDKNLVKSITAKEIAKYNINFNTISGLEIFNSHAPSHYELEPISNSSYKLAWEFSLADSQPVISVIIPSYNNSQFLCNVVWHLINQKTDPKLYEIIISDDGSTDNSSKILKQIFEEYKTKVNIKYIYWPKQHPLRGEQQFFRPGLARNLASRYSRGEFLQFLDSDILVPHNFIEICLNELKQNDLIQFQRFHINQELSKTAPHYEQIKLKSDTYIEEKDYWSELFFCDSWPQLPHYWKYTCTYALGISKAKFYDMGLFKKYYISYGFEDTDLGYESHKRNLKFNLVKLPLLHLTSYDQMQYKNSFTRRFKLLCTTAELFYLQHLDREIFDLLGNYYRAQKPVKSYFRDLFS